MPPFVLIALLQATAPHPADRVPWVTSEDYPAEAIRSSSEGAAGFDLTISPEGMPWRCDVTASSGSAALDQQTCALAMRRARLVPGRDADARPITSTFSSRVAWTLPDHRPVALAPMFDATVTISHLPDGLHGPIIVAATRVVTVTGTIERCDTDLKSPPALAAVACSQVAG